MSRPVQRSTRAAAAPAPTSSDRKPGTTSARHPLLSERFTRLEAGLEAIYGELADPNEEESVVERVRKLEEHWRRHAYRLAEVEKRTKQMDERAEEMYAMSGFDRMVLVVLLLLIVVVLYLVWGKQGGRTTVG